MRVKGKLVGTELDKDLSYLDRTIEVELPPVKPEDLKEGRVVLVKRKIKGIEKFGIRDYEETFWHREEIVAILEPEGKEVSGKIEVGDLVERIKDIAGDFPIGEIDVVNEVSDEYNIKLLGLVNHGRWYCGNYFKLIKKKEEPVMSKEQINKVIESDPNMPKEGPFQIDNFPALKMESYRGISEEGKKQMAQYNKLVDLVEKLYKKERD